MSPDDLPQQRIHEVIGLPQRPVPFESWAWDGPEPAPAGVILKNTPRSMVFLAHVEWAWSPAHNRLTAYYLHRGRTHWVLWSRYWDEDERGWQWLPAASVCRADVTEHQAAVYLLVDAWKAETSHSSLDQFHWINESDGLSVAELMAIGREVWD
jgi:hypothetical protein